MDTVCALSSGSALPLGLMEPVEWFHAIALAHVGCVNSRRSHGMNTNVKRSINGYKKQGKK